MKVNNRELGISTSCPLCGQHSFIEVNEDDYDAWCDGELVQNAFPYLSPEERESLISGICPECWTKLFPDAEDE